MLPQALRVVIPALGNEFITLIKESSLASAIGVMELYKRGDVIISQAFNAISVYMVTGLIYLAMTSSCINFRFKTRTLIIINMLEIKNLSKKFKPKSCLNNVSLSV